MDPRLNRGILIVMRLAAVVCCITWFYHWDLMYDFFYYPRNPDPITGRIVPYESRGVTVYIDPHESDLLSKLFWTEMISGLIALSLLFIQRRSK